MNDNASPERTGTNNHIDLSARVAVVTGGGSGLGLAIARHMLLSGATVQLWGRNLDRLERAAQELACVGRASVRSVDVTDFHAVQEAARAACRELGRVDILVNNAGSSPGIRPVTEVTLAEWRDNMAVNLDAVFFCSRSLVGGMIDRGWGRIVNVTSMAGEKGNPLQAAYSAAKAGVLGFTRSLAKEVARTGVTVNAVAPALFDTPLTAWAVRENPEAMQVARSKIPVGRLGLPHEAAAMVTWIASDQCSFTTGATFDLSGGRAIY